MSTLHQIREGFSKAWESLADGWRELRELAGDALTRFQPKTSHDDADAETDRLVRRASRWGLLAAEVSDDGRSIGVTLEVPGLTADDFDIEVVGNTLVVRGEKKLARDEVRGQYHVMERAYGQFERAIRLPAAVDDSKAKARYRAGVLTITMPKLKAGGSNRITVH